jgi:hypothetical protein
MFEQQLADAALAPQAELRRIDDELAGSADGAQVGPQCSYLIVQVKDGVDISRLGVEYVRQTSQSLADVVKLGELALSLVNGW